MTKAKYPNKIVVTNVTKRSKNSSFNTYLPYYIIGFLAFIIYSNTLFLDYTLDDRMVIFENTFVKQGVKGIDDIFTSDSFEGFFGKRNNLLEGGRYRPLSIAGFAIEYKIFGKSPFVSHLGNVLFYILICLLLYHLLINLFQNILQKNKWFKSIPFLIAILFVVHPIHTEAVANIKGRDELLSLLFSLACLYVFVVETKLHFALKSFLIFILFLFALLSKENAITFLAVIPLSVVLFKKTKLKEMLFSMLPLFVATLTYFLLRYNALGFFFSNGFESSELLNNPFLQATSLQKYATVFYTWAIYLKLLFIPHPLTHDYYPKQIPIVDFSNPFALIGLFAIIFIVIIAIIKFKKEPILAYGLSFFIITFSIQSNLLINIGTFMNERFMFIPSVGFLIAIVISISLLVKKFKFPEKIIISLVVITVCLFSLKTFSRNFAWQDDYTLFTTDVKVSSNSAKCNISAGGQILERLDKVNDTIIKMQMLERAVEYLRKGLDIHPKYQQGWVLLGNAYLKYKDYKSASLCYENSLKINPASADALNNILYTAQQAEKDNYIDIAIIIFNKTLTYKKDISDIVLAICDCYLKANKIDSAISLVKAKYKDTKNEYKYLAKLGEIYGKYLNNLDLALDYFKKSLALNNKYLSSNENIGIVYGLRKDYKNSLFYLQKALEIEPKNKRITLNIAQTYRLMGNIAKANEYMKMSEKL